MNEGNRLSSNHQLKELVVNIAKQLSSKENEKYDQVTLSTVATNLLSAGLIFPISLELNDLRKANWLLQNEGKQQAVLFLQEKVEKHERIQLHKKEIETSIVRWELFDIVHSAPEKWKETLDVSKELFLADEENFRLLLPLYYSY
ncbi:MAG: hypothetical protein LBL38_02525, partial [Lactobacillales bacterium]|nr:hypothetical protein [Lactobacillales bacterium]